jgi:hypothetical protein
MKSAAMVNANARAADGSTTTKLEDKKCVRSGQKAGSTMIDLKC